MADWVFNFVIHIIFCDAQDKKIHGVVSYLITNIQLLPKKRKDLKDK